MSSPVHTTPLNRDDIHTEIPWTSKPSSINPDPFISPALLPLNESGGISSVINKSSVFANANKLAIDNATELVAKFDPSPIFASMKKDNTSVKNQFGYNSRLLKLPTDDDSSSYDLFVRHVEDPNMNIGMYFDIFKYS